MFDKSSPNKLIFFLHIFGTTYNLSSELYLAKFNCLRKQLLIMKFGGERTGKIHSSKFFNYNFPIKSIVH